MPISPTTKVGILSTNEMKQVIILSMLILIAMAVADTANFTMQAAVLDSTSPTCTVTLANNSFISNNWTWINFTANKNISWAGFELDGSGLNTSMSNTSMVDWYSNQSSLSESQHNFTIYFNNTSGNMSSNGTFFFTVDITSPVYSDKKRNVDSPQETGDFIQFNVTWEDLSFDTVIFDWNGTNTTVVTYKDLGSNQREYYHTAEGTAIGIFNYTWYCNDTAGNLNFTDASAFRFYTPTSPDSGGGSTPDLPPYLPPQPDDEEEEEETDEADIPPNFIYERFAGLTKDFEGFNFTDKLEDEEILAFLDENKTFTLLLFGGLVVILVWLFVLGTLLPPKIAARVLQMKP